MMNQPAAVPQRPPESIVYVNGEFLLRSQAKVSVFDHAYMYGDVIDLPHGLGVASSHWLLDRWQVISFNLCLRPPQEAGQALLK